MSSIALAGERTVAERYVVYSNRVREGLYFGVWSMEHKEREGRIFLNGDCKAKPWAGIIFKAKVEEKAWLTLTDDWVAFGYVRFRINGLADPYGNHGAPCQFQVRLSGVGDRYLRIRGRFYEGQEGIDADPDTWQEVHVSLKYLGAEPGEEVTALALQCVGKPVRAFAIDGLSLVRFSGPRETTGRGTEISVAQPWVSWPAYEDLRPELKLDAVYPRYRGGAFVTADGRRTFLITQWGREDQLGALGVSRKDGGKVPHYDLYDPETQGFIYEQALNGRSMARLGFNCYAGQVHPVPFWRAVGYPGTYWGGFGEAEFREHVGDMKLPFYVDMVCFPWTLGKPGVDKKTNLSAEARHNGNLHWTPFRIIGRGRDVWLTMWRAYAERYKAAGADVLFYELMNEPAYQATTADHRDEFVGWLKERYGGLADLNAAWATLYRSWDEIRNFKGLRENAGIFFDYDEYLADRFADLVAAGQEAIDEITPGVPAAVQSMGGYCLRPRDAIFHHKLIPRSRAVLTPTGGGRWSRHLGNNAPKADTIDYGMSGSALANDLLLAMAGNKMIVDNEMYLGPRQTRVAVRNRWWQSVIVGMDGASWFSWSKRGWAWWKGRENIRREADLFPYSALLAPQNYRIEEAGSVAGPSPAARGV